MKKVAVGVVLLMFLVVISGCAKKESSVDSKILIGVALEKYDDNFMSFVRRAIENAAKEKVDIELMVNDAQRDQARQNEQIDMLISKGVKVLAINLVNVEAAKIIISKAKSKDIPIVFFNKEPEKELMDSYNKAYYIGTSLPESGIMQGEIIAKGFEKNNQWDKNQDGVLQYVILQGDPGHPDAIYRSKYVIEELNKRNIKIEQLEFQTGMWDAVKAKELMDTWLSKYNDSMELVVSGNDSMALGAIQSLKASGYFKDGKYIPVIGVDAIPDALEQIKSGTIFASILNDAKTQGFAVLQLSYNLAKGADILDGLNLKFESDNRSILVPYVPITTENIAIAEEAYR